MVGQYRADKSLLQSKEGASVAYSPLHLLASLALLVNVSAGFAADPLPAPESAIIKPEITIPQVAPAPALTTDLSGAPWNQAARISHLLALGTRQPAKQGTTIYLCYDPTSIWLAFRCDNLTGAKLKTDISERDGKLWRDDAVEFYCDPHQTGRDYYQFDVNAAGVVYDAQGENVEWNARFEALATQDDKGYTVAMRIPFAELKTTLPQPGQMWPVNLARQNPAGGSSWIWTRNGLAKLPEEFGRLIFGGPSVVAVKPTSPRPVSVGPNSLSLEDTSGMKCRVVGRNKNGAPIWRTDAQRKPKAFTFDITDDRIRSVDITFADEKGTMLATWVSLVMSPELTGRLVEWSARLETMGKVSAYWPEPIAEEAKKLTAQAQAKLDAARAIIGDRSKWTKPRWQRVATILADFDARLSNLSCLARTLEHFPKADFAIGFESPMRQVLIRDHLFEGWFDRQVTVRLAANEHEGVQLVVIPINRNLKNVRVRTNLEAPSGDAKPLVPACSVSLVGHVDGDDDPPYDLSYKGFWPDPLLNFKQNADVHAGEHVAFWLDVAAAKGTVAGDYRGTITVEADGCEPISIPLNIHVWDFELIDGTHLPTAFTYNEQAVRAFHKDRWNPTLARKYHDLLLDHRIGVDNLYRREAPDLDVVRYAFSRGANRINLCYTISHNPKQMQRVFEALDSCVPQLRQEGLLDKAYFYAFDEIRGEKFKEAQAVFDEIHRRYPGLQTMTTADDTTFGKETGLREAVDIWVPTTRNYVFAEGEQLRKEGKEMWWYVCLTPPHPYANWFIEYPAIESRLLMGTMTYKYRADGFLYYMVNNWRDNKKPIADGPYLTWNPASCPNRHQKWANGDGNLIYPGVDGPLSCIRLENIRDGLEDYEYLYILAERVKRVAELPPNAARDEFLKNARALLAIPDSLVRTVVEYTTDPAELSAWRFQMAKAIVAAGKLVQAVK